MTKFSRALGTITKTVSKHAPLAFTAVGIVGLGATAYFAYKSAKKVEVILDEKENYDNLIEYREDVQKQIDAGVDAQGDRIADEEFEILVRSRDEYDAHIGGLKEIDRLELVKRMSAAVALPVITGVASIACITASYYMLNNRVLNLAAALATSTAEREYLRRRTEQEFGKEGMEKVYNAPISKQDVTTTDAKGKEKTTSEDVADNIVSLHGEWFKNSDNYVRDDHDYNLQFIDSIEATLENRLFTRGYITLNEVYDKLGFPRSRAGAMVGWTTSSHSAFGLDTECPLVTDPETGLKHPEIYVKWSAPTDIYNQIEFDGRYSI